jgi:hypothetical protein
VHHAEGGGGGLAGRDMWHGGGRSPAPAAHESGGDGQRSGGAGGRGVGEGGWQVGRLGGWGPAIEREEEGREEERLMGGTGSGWDPLAGRGGRERCPVGRWV